MIAAPSHSEYLSTLASAVLDVFQRTERPDVYPAACEFFVAWGSWQSSNGARSCGAVLTAD